MRDTAIIHPHLRWRHFSFFEAVSYDSGIFLLDRSLYIYELRVLALNSALCSALFLSLPCVYHHIFQAYSLLFETTYYRVMSETQEQESSFPIGSRVLLHSLQKGTEYNNQVGIVQSNLSDKGRQSVHILPSNNGGGTDNDDKKVVLGLKPTNLKYQPRTIESLTNKELKQLLMMKEYTTSQIVGMDKSQLKELVSTVLSDEVEIAKQLAIIHAPKGDAAPSTSNSSKASNLRQQVTSQAQQLSSLSPAQMRQQAQMMRSMPPNQLRRMNPAMAHMTDAQIQMAIMQMEQMAQNPANVQNMVNSMNNMTEEQLEQIHQATAGGGGDGGGGGGVAAAPTIPAANGGGVSPPVSSNQMQSNLEQMSNLSPDQLRHQAQMMKSMTPDQLRSMNPAMANWSDAQVQQSISQMELMANNPQMVQSMMDQVKGMDPEQLRKMQEMASSGNMDMSGLGGMMNGDGNAATVGGGGAPGGMPQDPMAMLQNSSPAQIKQMLSMVKENPSLLKEMLKSANPDMANSLSEDQLMKSLDYFANLDEKKLGWMLKAFQTMGSIKTKMQGKGLVVLVLSFVVFCYGLLMLVLKYKSGSDDATASVQEMMESDIPPVPIVDDEFASEF